MEGLGVPRKMKLPTPGPLVKEPANRRPCCHKLLGVAVLFCITFFIGSMLLTTGYKENTPTLGVIESVKPNLCQASFKPTGSESLPKGIISSLSDLEMKQLSGSSTKKGNVEASKNLLAMPVGIKQKEMVDKIVEKFLSQNFSVMLFHYDGIVDEWRDLHWSSSAIHVSAVNQTKWWFAKRFLHPDIVSEYSHIFLWDEDLDLENFHPGRYLSIVKEEGLEISQPALDPHGSEVHHQITRRSKRTKVHRRIYRSAGNTRCYENSTRPPCTGWVEMMAPVFSRASWRCVWHMIQNDLIHAWGLDMKLGYCAQGDQTQKVGVVDAEYIVHKGIPSLGGIDEKSITAEAPGSAQHRRNSRSSCSSQKRCQVRLRSYAEQNMFRQRWQKAVEDDHCWKDPYPESARANR